NTTYTLARTNNDRDKHRGRLRNRGNLPPTGRSHRSHAPNNRCSCPLLNVGTTIDTTYCATVRLRLRGKLCQAFPSLSLVPGRAYADTTQSGSERDFTNNDYPSTSASSKTSPIRKERLRQ